MRSSAFTEAGLKTAKFAAQVLSGGGQLAIDYCNEKSAIVKRLSLFSGISLADCATITSSAREGDFSRKQIVFAEGDPIRQTVLLLSGCAKITQFGEDGSEVILRLAGPGEILGALGASADVGHCSTAQIMGPSSVLTWSKANFESLLERFPLLQRNVIRALEMRLRDMDQRFREVSTQKVALRLSSQLIRLLNQIGKQSNGHVEISLSRAELAQLTGTTLFTVSRLLSQWDGLGIVEARRESVMVMDLPALVELSHQGEPELISLRTRSTA
jgi:CRP/FNR family transcriptional regulator, nitrogen oxide reductase regulator